MKKRMLALMMAAVMCVSIAACGGKAADAPAAQQETQEEKKEEAAADPAEAEGKEPAESAEAPAEVEGKEPAETEEAPVEAVTSEPAESAIEAPAAATAEFASEAAEPAGDALRLFVLSGPTGVGAMNLWAAADAGETARPYDITMTGENDEIVAALSKGEADIAAIATNLASTLYNKTEGKISVLAVNTLGVLSILAPAGLSGEEIASVADLKGKTIYSPGQGANPEYVLRYVLNGNGIDPDMDVTIQFVGEGSELLSVWQNDPEALIMAPQPVATTLLMQNEGAAKLFDMTDEWDAVSGGQSRLMMGCVVVRKAYLEENPDAVETFLTEYRASIEKAQSDVEGTAALCESYGLIPKAAIAQKAIPQCGLTFITGEDMKEQLGGYLQVMYDAAPGSVGGALPADDFYY
ncbi:MAG: ABC transporter substrate-binding protein [Eubacteriales bacterium]|nr:ABC transporter substrate-binding protein [Eubacteriales bacterium]